MFKNTILLFGLVLWFSSSFAQYENTPNDFRNAVLLEFGGHGFAYSFAYERDLLVTEKLGMRAQAGFSFYGLGGGVIPIWIPVSINESIRIGKSNWHGEIGLGMMFWIEDLQNDGRPPFPNPNRSLDVNLTMRAGIRYQSENGRFVGRLGYTPFVLAEAEYIHWAGAAVGMRF
ncbi:MAG: hypothetical protein AAF206_17300 [Bacteroidota bacterium]